MNAQSGTILAFHSARSGRMPARTPEPPQGGPDHPLPDREWSLSASQVVIVVVAIVAVCQVLGMVF